MRQPSCPPDAANGIFAAVVSVVKVPIAGVRVVGRAFGMVRVETGALGMVCVVRGAFAAVTAVKGTFGTVRVVGDTFAPFSARQPGVRCGAHESPLRSTPTG